MKQCVIITNREGAEFLSEQLDALDVHACTFNDAQDNPIYEPELDRLILWNEVILTVYFDEEIEKELSAFLLNPDIACHIIQSRTEVVPERDWVRLSLDQFKPQYFGERLAIYPSWCEKPNVSVAIQLDPGLAFGTGSHPTTRLCLEYLSAHIQGGEEVIDYGCGSGILALAAKQLGASCVIAIDHDEQALLACRQNAIANQVDLSLEKFLISLPQEMILRPADILIANILSQPLIELAPKLSALVKASGHLILSGILKEQEEAVKAAYQTQFDFEETKILEGWCLLSGKKKLV